MAQTDSWIREYEDATRLADDIAARVTERNASSASGADTSRLVSATRRKLTMLGTKLDSLLSLLSNPSYNKAISEKELTRRQDLVHGLRARMNQMVNNLNAPLATNRSNLLAQDGKVQPTETNRTAGLDNYGIVGLQRQIMKEQDADLLKLEETVTSTKHIALAVNEELDLHASLLDNLDQEADLTNTRLKSVQRRLGFLSKRASSGCSCMCLLLMLLAIVILVLVIWALIRFL